MAGGNDWFATESGQRLTTMATRRAGPWLEHLVGHNALILQPCTQGLPVPELRFQSLFRLERANARFYGDFQADDLCLPLASDCLALVYAAFVLETSPDSEALVSEIERLLVAEGHLAMLTLNPFSPSRLGGKWQGYGLRSATQWQHVLRHAGFELLRRESFGESYRPGALCSVNFLLARKRKTALTPIRKHASAALIREPSAS
mgnify:FL=1